MARRRREPDEAFGPMLDGASELEELARRLRELPEEDEPAPELILPEPEMPQVVLLCGSGATALATARLARQCGFDIELACREAPEAGDELAELAQAAHVLEDYDDMVSACEVDRNHYVCVFEDDPEICAHILSQCLPSSAAYLGVDADMAGRRAIFASLREGYAPDAELAAICCPMGLSLGAEGAEQRAVAIVAELLAAKSGVLKRLRFVD